MVCGRHCREYMPGMGNECFFKAHHPQFLASRSCRKEKDRCIANAHWHEETVPRMGIAQRMAHRRRCQPTPDGDDARVDAQGGQMERPCRAVAPTTRQAHHPGRGTAAHSSLPTTAGSRRRDRRSAAQSARDSRRYAVTHAPEDCRPRPGPSASGRYGHPAAGLTPRR